MGVGNERNEWKRKDKNKRNRNGYIDCIHHILAQIFIILSIGSLCQGFAQLFYHQNLEGIPNAKEFAIRTTVNRNHLQRDVAVEDGVRNTETEGKIKKMKAFMEQLDK